MQLTNLLACPAPNWMKKLTRECTLAKVHTGIQLPFFNGF
jgi:hypothetical protein